MTITVGPDPFAIETIGTTSRDHWFDERGTPSVPNCFPSAVRSIVQETRVSAMPRADSRGLSTIAL